MLPPSRSLALALALLCPSLAHAVTCRVRTSPMSPGDVAMAQADFPKAVTLYDQERKTSGPEGDRVHAAMIRALLHEAKVDDAEKEAVAWSSGQPSNAWSLVALGEVQWRKGTIPEALTTLKKAYALDPCIARTLADFGRFYLVSGMYATGNRQLTQAHRLDPFDDEIESRWLRLQPRAVQVAELTTLLAHATFLTDDERKFVTRWKDRASQPPAASCQLVSSIGSTSIPFHGIQNGPKARTLWGLEVGFNGKVRRLQIDTGASGLLLSADGAKMLHLLPEDHSKVGGIGDQGNVDSVTAKVHSLTVGGLEFRDCDVTVLKTNPPVMGGADGLIGGDVFSDFLLTLDFPGQTLKLAPLPPRPNKPSTQSAPTLQTAASSSDFVPQDRYVDPSMKDWTNIFIVGHDLILLVRVSTGSWHLFMLDTGSSANQISLQAARELGKSWTDPYGKVIGISGVVKKTDLIGPFGLEFAGLSYPPTTFLAIDMENISYPIGMELGGLIGSPILHQLTMTVDYRDNLVNFSYDPRRIRHCTNDIDRDVTIPDCY